MTTSSFREPAVFRLKTRRRPGTGGGVERGDRGAGPGNGSRLGPTDERRAVLGRQAPAPFPAPSPAALSPSRPSCLQLPAPLGGNLRRDGRRSFRRGSDRGIRRRATRRAGPGAG